MSGLRAGWSEFATVWQPRLRAMPCFRPPTEVEVDTSYAAYVAGDARALCARWREVAAPIRATLPFPSSVVYPRLGRAPRAFNAASFLVMVRAALEAGVRFRSGLSAPVQHALTTEFPWLERRHEHVPVGPAPHLDFPPVFAAFVDAPDLDDACARWQLCTALNEVQQSWYSRTTADACGLPDLHRHADREEALAIHYLASWSPTCSHALWRQVLWVLDALNAALFDWAARTHTTELVCRSVWSAIAHHDEWRAFVTGLDTPQALWPLEGRPASRERIGDAGAS